MADAHIAQTIAETSGLFVAFVIERSVRGLQTSRGIAGRLSVADEIDRHGARA
jgi:hypothetical protein